MPSKWRFNWFGKKIIEMPQKPFARTKLLFRFVPRRDLGSVQPERNMWIIIIFISDFVSHTFPQVAVCCLLLIICIILRISSNTLYLYSYTIYWFRLQTRNCANKEKKLWNGEEKKTLSWVGAFHLECFFLFDNFCTCKNAIVTNVACTPCDNLPRVHDLVHARAHDSIRAVWILYFPHIWHTLPVIARGRARL